MPLEKKPFLRTHRLIPPLIISGMLNIFLLSLLLYWTLKDSPPTPYCEKKPADEKQREVPLASDHSNQEVLRYFRTLPKDLLVAKLTEVQLIENGYSIRDLALASLVAFHQFDLSRALLGYAQPDQKRRLCYGIRQNGKRAEVIVFPSLSEEQFQVIVNFAKAERWPYTSRGLFMLIKNKESDDPTLLDAFFLTPEFLAVEMLFNRAEVQVEKREILNILLEGNWRMFFLFSEQQRLAQDLSVARRQRFLLDYIKVKSKAAAFMMLKTDGQFAAKKLDDDSVFLMLELLEKKDPLAEKFALELLISPRSDAVWQMAANRLYDYSGDPRPEKYQHHAALMRFVPQQKGKVESLIREEVAVIAQNTPPVSISNPSDSAAKRSPVKSTLPISLPPAPSKRDKIYIVQHGDSLWKIAKRFKVDVEVIRQRNHLESDMLKPGTPLRIP